MREMIQLCVNFAGNKYNYYESTAEIYMAY